MNGSKSIAGSFRRGNPARSLLILTGLITICFCVPQISYAATFTVTRNDDRNGVCVSNVDCSLREAVAAANGVGTDDSINFAPNLSMITLSAEIIVSQNGTLNIVGPGAAKLTIDGGPGSNRLLYFAGPTATVSNLAMTGGGGTGAQFTNAGGAIYAFGGSLTLDNVYIYGNAAQNNTGGVYFSGGTHIIKNSTIANNSAASCTGIASSSGSLTISNSTISGNTATSNGGAGGAMCVNGTIEIRSATITKNTCAGFGGGIYFGSGSLSLLDSIVSENSAPNYPEIDNGGETIVTGGFNLIGDSSGDAANTNHTISYQGSDILDTPAKLLPLLTRGGSMPTHAPAMSSPAIDKGFNISDSTDQRGIVRRFDFPAIVNAVGGNGTDIGAVERQLADNPLGVSFDFDNDAKTDLSIFRPTPGEWWFVRSSDGQNQAFKFGISTDKIAPADFTGDGKMDITFYRPSTGEWFILRSEDNSYYSVAFGLTGDTPVPADYDGDGKADPAIFRPSSAIWYALKSSGGVMNRQFGVPGDVPVPANYDEDGKTDLAIFRPSVGEWWIDRSELGLVAYQFGNSSDRPVPGDFTGDSFADVAFWRPSTGFWYVLRSENLSFYAFPFGSSGDLPVPGDYDGDGKVDAAVFRPSTSTWYVSRSTAGVLIQQFGIAGDLPLPNAYIP